jgi:hypothetical protein
VLAGGTGQLRESRRGDIVGRQKRLQSQLGDGDVDGGSEEYGETSLD